MGFLVGFDNSTMVAWLRFLGMLGMALVVMWFPGLDDALRWLRWWVETWWLVVLFISMVGYDGGLMLL